MNITEEQWLTGFTEGDGSIGLYRSIQVTYGQKEREILDYINSLHPGGHVSRDKLNFYRLFYRSNRTCVPLLAILAKYVVSIHTSKRLNTILNSLDIPSITAHNPTLHWLAGFFDAEGSSDNQPHISISQKGRDTLDAIMSMFGGRVHGPADGDMYIWKLYGNKGLELLQTLANECHNTTKIARAFSNFGSPTYSTLHKPEKQAYDKEHYAVHKEEVSAYGKNYYETHKEEHQVCNRINYERRRNEQRMVRDYLKLHPEVVEAYQQQLMQSKGSQES